MARAMGLGFSLRRHGARWIVVLQRQAVAERSTSRLALRALVRLAEMMA